MLIKYLNNLSTGRLILWCYIVWYLVVLVRYFDPHPRLWLTSLGLGLIVGFALYTNAVSSSSGKVKLDPWQTFRFFLTPFCVSSFSALVKNEGFFLVFSPRPSEVLFAIGICTLLCLVVTLVKRRYRHTEIVNRPHKWLGAYRQKSRDSESYVSSIRGSAWY